MMVRKQDLYRRPLRRTVDLPFFGPSAHGLGRVWLWESPGDRILCLEMIGQ